MPIFDTIVLLIILICAFSGWRKGLASQIASIVSLAASCFVATNYPGFLASKIDAVPPWNNYAAMLILFLGTSIIIWLIFRRINSTIDEMKLGDFDHQLGAIFGGAKGFILASLVTLFAIGFLNESTRASIINQSKSGAIIATFLHRVRPYVPARALTYTAPFFDRLDEIRPSHVPVNGGYQVNQGGLNPPGAYTPLPGTDGQPAGQNSGSHGVYGSNQNYPLSTYPPTGQQPAPIYRPPPQTSGGPNWNAPPSGGRF